MIGFRFNLDWLKNFFIVARTGVIGGTLVDFYNSWTWPSERRILMMPFEAGLGGGFAWGKAIKFVLHIGAGYRGLFGISNAVGDVHSFYLNGSIGIGWGTKHYQ